MEAIDPTVHAIMDDVVLAANGAASIRNYADWIIRLRALPPRSSPRLFVQLTHLADQYLAAGCPSVAVSLAVLARIGLPQPPRLPLGND